MLKTHSFEQTMSHKLNFFGYDKIKPKSTSNLVTRFYSFLQILAHKIKEDC